MQSSSKYVWKLCSLFALFALTCGSIWSNSQSAGPSNSQTFRVGLKSIVIPPPSAELSETGSDYRVLFEILAPNTNRLVAAFLLPEELKATVSGTSSLSRYSLVQVPRRAEFANVTPDIYKQIADSMAGQFGATFDGTLKDQTDELNRRLKSVNSDAPTVTMDKPLMLGKLFSKPDACSFGMIMPISANGKTKKMAAAISILRIQERVVFFYTYTEYTNEDSFKWARTTAEQWADVVLKANQ